MKADLKLLISYEYWLSDINSHHKHEMTNSKQNIIASASQSNSKHTEMGNIC